MLKSTSTFLSVSNISILLRCNINRTAVTCNGFKIQLIKQQKIMAKLLHRAEGERRKISPAPNMKTLTKMDGEDGRSGRKRMSVLNKLFMRYITDLLTTGDLAEMVRGRQLEISQVKVSPNFSVVYVMWLSRGDPKETQLEEVLTKVAGILRHELSQLKIVGVVPVIQFVKDTQYSKVMEVERALAKADFGEDFEPTFSSTKLKSELVLNTKLESDVVEKIQQLEKKYENEEFIDVPMPPMRHDVFGLDRNRMIGRIERIVFKSPHERWNPEDIQDLSYASSEGENINFNKFIKEKEMTYRKRERLAKNKIPTECEEIVEIQRSKYFTNDDVDFDNNYFDHEEEVVEK